ncbi:PREDICTED: centromere-associated protein E-like [Camelina sativa]|uniref:Centromere-associated protein E-like n=1 Tax=Camelina sativa TaxID=90675 RepID=A0ABM1QJ52_CAMSA|nr:PREDICTED: centromere-associated protein E-like [Camelina sativa]
METGVVIIQEPVSTKTNVGEAPAGVILDKSSMEVQKVNLSTVLDDEISSGDFRNGIIPGETDVADIVNGSGNIETEELKHEKGEATKNISVVEDSKIVSETEKDEQGSIFVHKPESLNKDIEDAKIISSDVTLEKDKEPEEVSVEKPVIEEDHTETKHSPEQEDEIGNISKAREEIPKQTDEFKEEKDSRTVETAVNGTEAEHNATVSVEEISRNGDNIVNETVPEDQTATDGESPLHVTETTQRVLPELEKDPEIVYKEETAVLEPVSLKETAEPVEPIKNSDNAEQISRGVTVDIGKEEDISQNTEEVQESSRVIETPTIKGEDIESKASLDHEVKSKETVPEKETTTDGESLHEYENTERVLPEAEKEEDKEEMKTDEVRSLNVIEKVETVTVKTVTDDPELVNNEENTVHESESLKENAEPVEAIRSSDEITQNREEIQVPSLIETWKIQGEDNESRVSLDTKAEVDHSSNETEEHEHVSGRDLPKCETLEVEAVETKEEDLKEDKEKEETEAAKTIISSNEVSSSTVQEEFGEHIDPCSSEIKDESHGREESVEVKSKETDQGENTAEKHKGLLDVSSTESKKYQENEPETTIVAGTEKFEESPSDLALNVDKEEQNDEKIKVDRVDGTQIMEEQRGLDSNGVEAEQIDPNRTDETEERPVAKQVSLPDVEPVEQMQKPSLDSPSQVSEETSKTVDAEIDERPEEEKVTLHQEDQVEGSYGLGTIKETVSVPESIETGEKSLEERNVIDLTPLQEESSQTNEKKEETKLEKHELTNEEVKSDEVIEVSSTLLPKELEGETVVEAEKIENNKENEEEAAAVDNLETVESHNSLPSSSEEQEHGTVSEKIEDEKVEEVPMVQIKSHERQEEVSKAVEEQTIDMKPSLTEKCSTDQNQPEEQVEEACSRDEQDKEISSNSENIVNETYALHNAEAEEEETATNGESLHDVETTKRDLLEVEKEEEAEIKKDAEPRLDVTEKKELETEKIVVEDIDVVNNEEATTHESESLKGDDHQSENAESVEAIKNSDDAEKISSEVTGDIEKDEDITQKAEEVQESSRVIEIPTIQGEDNESKPSLELKEEVYQSSKDTEQHQHVLERDIPQCVEAIGTSTVQEAAILNTSETNNSETEAVHSEMGGAEEGQETKEDTETSLDLKVGKEQKEPETVKTVIFSDEVKSSDQAEEHTEPYTSEIKNESQGREESVEIKSKDNVQDENSEEKDVNLPNVRSGESEKYQENEPVTSLVSKTESVDKFEEIPSAVEGAGLNESTHNQTLVDVESVEKVHKPSLETPSELSEHTSKAVDEKIEDKPIEEVTFDQEGQDEGSNGLETKEETGSVPESTELGEKTQEEESCLQNEQKKEVKLQKEQMYKHEPTEEEVSNDQQSPVEEKSDDVIQVSSALPSEGPEDETVVKAEKIGEEQVADEMTVETSSLLSSSEEQEHVTVPEKTDGDEVKETEPLGDMREKGLEIAETAHLSLPSVDQNEDVKAFDEEIQIPTATLPLEDQEKVTSTEKGETKANETEDDKQDEHVDSSTSPMFSEKNDDETQVAEGEKRDEEITVGTSKTSENVCIQQDEFEKPEATKLEEFKEDKSQEIEDTSDQTLPIQTPQAENTLSSELVSEQEDQTPKQVEDIYEEEHKVEAMGSRNLPVETLQAYQSQSPDLISALNDQTPKHVEETHEEETKEEHKLQADGILPTETIPRESSDDALVSMLASKEDGQVTLQEDTCADDVRETKDTQDERPVSVEIEESVGEIQPKEHEDEMRDEHVETPTSSIILEKNDNETLIAEAKKEDEDINETETAVALESLGTSTKPENMSLKQEEFGNPEVPKLEESKEEKIQEIPETDKAIDATGDQSLPFETSQDNKTSSSDLALNQVQEVHEEETKEEHKLQVAVDQIPSLASEQDDQIPKKVEEILEEETKDTQKVQAHDILNTKTAPRESFSEAPVPMLASGEDEPVTPQEGNCAGDTLEEKVGETKAKESEVEGTEKSDDLVETSTKLTKVEDAASTKKTEVEDAELTNDYPTEEAENRDETYSTLPVVGILTELQNTLETERTINESASKGDIMTKEPADQDQKTGDAGVESNEKDSATGIIEENTLQKDENGETEKIQEENCLPGKSLPIEEINLQEEHQEEVKVQDGISRDFEVNDEEKLQEGIREIPANQSITEVLRGEKILIPSSVLPSEELEDVISPEKQEECEPQQDFNASKSEKISLQEEQKDETHETVKQEDQVVDIKDEKKDDEEQEIVSSKVNKDKEDASELGVGNDFVSRDVEKEEVPHGVLENEEEINEVVKSEKQITDPVGVITKASEAEHESNQEPVKTQADTKKHDERDLSTEEALKMQREEDSADKYLTKEVLSEQLQVPSSTALDDLKDNNTSEADCDLSVQKPSELIQSHQSHNLPLEENVEEASFGVKKAQDDKNEENGNALITKENLQVQDQPKHFEALAIEKEISEHELTSNAPTHVQEDIGTNVKPAIHDEEIRADSHDSVVMPREETGLIEEKREVEHVKTEPEDAIKHGIPVEENNKTSENIDRQAAQEESKQTYTIEEDLRKEVKETNQESFENVKQPDDAIEKTQPEIQDIDSLSFVSKTQDNPEQKDEVPNQQERNIADEVPNLENQKIAEEVQQKDGESERTKDLFSAVKETEPTLKEPARKSLSDLIQKVKGTNKTEDVTTEPHIEEKPKTVEEDENDNGDHEHDKDDKTSPDSIVMVEAKDTVSIIKTHKKSHGLLSGVGSKVKHSISKVKKVLTGKSSHTTKPSSPK